MLKFSVSGKTLLVLFVSFSLLTSVSIGTAFADDDKKKKTFEEMCAKKKGNSPDALFCQAILGLRQSTNSFFDVFADLKLVDEDLQNQIDSFFDIFVELDDVANNQCPNGQVATGTNIDGSLQCTDLTQNQDCADGYYVSGIDENGQIKCKPLPSSSNLSCGDGIVTAPETCDDGDTINGDGCSATCSTEGSGGSCVFGEVQSCYSGPPSTLGVGICSAGTQICDSNGQFGACTGEVTPQAESSDSLDNDCNGSVDDNFCGNGIIDPGEECDGEYGGPSCFDLGFNAGSIQCTSSCMIHSNCQDNTCLNC